MITNITTYEEYKKALERLLEIFDAPIGTIESNEANVLIDLIEDYENINDIGFDIL